MNKKLFAVVAVALALGMASPAFAASNDITLSSDLTISLTGPGITITVLSGGTMAGYTVTTTSLVLNLENGSSVTVQSAGGLNLANDFSPATSSSCVNTTTSQLVLASTITQTVTITPGSVQCATSAGGVSSGGGSTTPTPTPTPPITTPPPSSSGGSAGGAHPDGTLILDGKTIYIIKDGKRYGFRDAAEYESQGYRFNQAVPATDADKALSFAPANIEKALVGTLVLDASDGKTVFMIGENGTKRGFASAQVFKDLGYSFTGLLKVNLSDYPAGPVITESSQAHPEGALVLDGKTVWWLRNGMKQGFESEAVFKTYGFSFARVVPANAADKALPTGPLVRFRDGTLVQDGTNYYIISDGKKLQFASLAVLRARGYDSANLIVASLSAYTSAGATLN